MPQRWIRESHVWVAPDWSTVIQIGEFGIGTTGWGASGYSVTLNLRIPLAVLTLLSARLLLGKIRDPKSKTELALAKA